MIKEKDQEALQNIVDTLRRVYGTAKPGLNYENPFELLIATILSAQCTDERVNSITAILFKKYRTPESIVAMEEIELVEIIRSCGLFRMKSKHIRETCGILISDYGGRVPRTREDLMRLPGVGRKTANVVLSQAFGKPAIAVDTHVMRVSGRIGLAASKSPDKIEQELMKIFKEEEWGAAHLWLIHHGREICTARNPKCSLCMIKSGCADYRNRVD